MAERDTGRVKVDVEGMTCAGCERRIEQALSRVPGVVRARADHVRGTAEAGFAAGTADRGALERAIEASGYRVLPAGSRKHAFTPLQLAAIGVVLLGLFLLLQRTGIFARLPKVSTTMSYGLMLVVGLATSLHCVAMCGGISLSQSVNRAVAGQASVLGRVRPGLLYNAGRVLSYTIVGGAAGALGSAVSFSGAARSVLIAVVGLFMVLLGFNQLGLFPWLRRITPRLPRAFSRAVAGAGNGRGPFVVGLLNGFLPCGPLQSMQVYALGTGSFLAGALSMLLFSLGTVPLVLGLGALGSLLTRRFSERLVKVGALLVMLLGAAMVVRAANLSGMDLRFWRSPPAPAANVARLEGGVQVVRTNMQSSSYEPIIVQKGLPVRWTIRAEPSSLNGCNNPLTIPAYGIERRLEPGDNLIEFTPVIAGNVLYTCWMGMISGTIRVVDDITRVTDKDRREIARPGGGEAGGAPGAAGGCCSTAVAGLPPGFTLPTQRVALARLVDGVQRVEIEVTARGYNPAIVVLQRGVPAEWTFRARKLDEENYRLVFPAYQVRLELNDGDNLITLTPESDFHFDSWKGTLHGYIRVVEDLDAVRVREVREYVKLRMAEVSPASL